MSLGASIALAAVMVVLGSIAGALFVWWMDRRRWARLGKEATLRIRAEAEVVNGAALEAERDRTDDEAAAEFQSNFPVSGR